MKSIELIDIESIASDRAGITREDGVIELLSDADEALGRRPYPSSPTIRSTGGTVDVSIGNRQLWLHSIELNGEFQEDDSEDAEETIGKKPADAQLGSDACTAPDVSIQEFLQTFTPPKPPAGRIIKGPGPSRASSRQGISKLQPKDVLQDILVELDDNLSSWDTPSTSGIRSPETVANLAAKWVNKTEKNGSKPPYGRPRSSGSRGNILLKRTLANRNNILSSELGGESSPSRLTLQVPPSGKGNDDDKNQTTNVMSTGGFDIGTMEKQTLNGSASNDKIQHVPASSPESVSFLEGLPDTPTSKTVHLPQRCIAAANTGYTKDNCASTPRSIATAEYLEPIDTDTSVLSTAGNTQPHSPTKTPKVDHDEGRRDYIVHSKAFTADESKAKIKQLLSNIALKKQFNEVNKVTREKQSLLAEIVLSINEHVHQYLLEQKAPIEEVLGPTTIIHNYESIPVIRFKRKCTSIYDLTNDIYYPCEPTMCNEPICVLFYNAIDFFTKYKNKRLRLYSEVEDLKRAGNKVIVILNEYSRLEKSLAQLENKCMRSRVEQQLTGDTSPRRKTVREMQLAALGMNSKDLSRKINEMIIRCDIDIFPVNSAASFANWVSNLVWVVAKIRYDPMMKNADWSHINVKIGKTATEVLSKTLQQINGVTEIRAGRVTSAYPSFQQLFTDFEKGYLVAGKDGNPLMTKVAEKAMNALFMSEDPEEKIYIN
ncbi:AaceriADL318Cp [[Ashbya] aceris (nom. inval.)]|nr:AaceriADL318Cp [[Ashbya] aceris (nom. inval.)]